MALLALNLSEYIADYNHGGSGGAILRHLFTTEAATPRVVSAHNLHPVRAYAAEEYLRNRACRGSRAIVFRAIVEGF